jgi:hypothetical protein
MYFYRKILLLILKARLGHYYGYCRCLDLATRLPPKLENGTAQHITNRLNR